MDALFRKSPCESFHKCEMSADVERVENEWNVLVWTARNGSNDSRHLLNTHSCSTEMAHHIYKGYIFYYILSGMTCHSHNHTIGDTVLRCMHVWVMAALRQAQMTRSSKFDPCPPSIGLEGNWARRYAPCVESTENLMSTQRLRVTIHIQIDISSSHEDLP